MAPDLGTLEVAYPWIAWRQPVIVNDRYGCRVCIGVRGLKGNEVELLPVTREEWASHFTANHGAPGGAKGGG